MPARKENQSLGFTRHLRRRLTYANVVATVALFAALGGSSYAAIKLAPGSVGNKELRNGAVTSTKVKKGSLLARDFKPGQVPRGATGPSGRPERQVRQDPQGRRGRRESQARVAQVTSGPCAKPARTTRSRFPPEASSSAELSTSDKL